VWAGIIGNNLMGPYIFPPRLTADAYFFLNTHLGGLLEDIPLITRRDMWYLHDGALAHFAREGRGWLDQNFSGKWIGRTVLWPPRSPDLKPCDFFLSSYETINLRDTY
jgi:hypothetical protein